jgi:hypothetical protein
VSAIDDLVIEELASCEAALVERVASLEADVASYRELAQQGIAALAVVTKERDQARRRLYALLDERRVAQQQKAA